MRRTLAAVLGAATSVAALALSGCSAPDASRAAAISPAPPAAPATAAAPDSAAPLPPAEALTEVMYRLADPAVPGADKLALVADTGPADAGTLDRFAAALRDGGFTPVTFTATDIRWSDNHPGDALATLTVGSAPGADIGTFSFPMEFGPRPGGWQLTRETAEMLLAFGNARTAPS